MPQRFYKHWAPAEIQQLRQYCAEGASIAYIADNMQRTPAAIVGELWKSAKQDSSWRPFAHQYSRGYHDYLRQIPLGQSNANSLRSFLMEFPYATISELQQIGFGKTLSQYPGGIKQARKDAESRKFMEAYSIYNEFVSDVSSGTSQMADKKFSSPEMKLIKAVFGEIPYFYSPRHRDVFRSYVRAYVIEHPPARGENLEAYRSRLMSDFNDSLEKQTQNIMGEGKLRELIDEALSSLAPRERRIIELRFLAERRYTLEEIGNLPEFNVNRERIRQIEAKALRKLRHPGRSRKLQDYFKDKRLGMLEQSRDAYGNPDAELFYSIIGRLEGRVSGLQRNVDYLEKDFVSVGALRQRLKQLERHQTRDQPEDGVSLSYLGLGVEERLSDRGITTVGQLKQLPDYELGKIMPWLSDYEAVKRKLQSYEKAEELGISVSEEPIERLELNARASNALLRGGISRTWELQTMTEDDLSKVKNIGQKALGEIKEKLAERRLTLREG